MPRSAGPELRLSVTRPYGNMRPFCLEMPTVRLWILAAATAALMTPAWADVPPHPEHGAVEGIAEPQATAAPDAFIRSIYEVKLSAEVIRADLGRNTTSHIILYYFTPELLALYKSAMQIDEPIVDGDMFMMSQEWDTKAADIAIKTLSQTKTDASVEAVFKTYGQDRKVTYTLKATPGGRWQIDNISDPQSGDVRSWIARGMKDAGQ